MHLKWKDATRDVVIETVPHDRCVKKVSEIFELVKAEETKRLGQDKMEQASGVIVDRLQKWINDHKSKLKSAHFTLRDGGPLFLAVTKDLSFDMDLQDSIVALILKYAKTKSVAHSPLTSCLCQGCQKKPSEHSPIQDTVWTTRSRTRKCLLHKTMLL